MSEHEDITQEDIKSEVPKITKREKIIIGLKSVKPSVTKKLAERKVSQAVKREEKFTGRLVKLGREKEIEESKLAVLTVKRKKRELEQESKAKVRLSKQKGQKPSFISGLITKTIVGKPIKVIKRRKIKIKSKRKITKKGKSKVKVSKSKTIKITVG